MNLNDLEKEIERHNKLYWVDNNPEISDEIYDQLMIKLKELDPNHPLLNYVGTPNNAPPIMLSLDKVYDGSELKKWCRKFARDQNEKFILQPKYDGWAIYYNGSDKLLTRGNENIISKIELIKVISANYTGPLLNYKESILGEIVLTKTSFDELNSKYKTSRSALAGILSSDDLVYNHMCLDLVDYDLFSQEFSLDNLDEFDWDKVHENLKNWDFPTDGLVIKLADKDYSNSLGFTNHHPRGQVAFKPKNPNAITKLKSIDWFVGKKNTVTPVAILEPVDIHGHTIQKASLHNYDELVRLNLHIGDTVLIERCGEIIPQIKKAFPGENRQEIIIPRCPSCDSEIYYKSPFLYCENEDCLGSLAKRLVDSCKRLDIESLGPGNINKLLNYGIEDIIDILNITKQDLAHLDGFKDKSVENLYNEIQRRINTPIEDWKVLASLNIPNIGRTISKKLLKNYTLDELIELEFEDLLTIEFMGPKRSEDLYDGLDNNYILSEMMAIFNIIDSKSNNNIKQLTVCFTGKMPEVRSYYERLAEEKNMIAVNSITKDLDLLIAADINDTRGKLTKARKLGIKIISLGEFLNG